MRWLEEHNIGYPTPWAKVPLVPTAVVFDLNAGSSSVRPDALSGYRACDTASTGPFDEGNVGAGSGTTVGKWKGTEFWMKGGLGSASVEQSGTILAGARRSDGSFFGATEPYRPLARGKVLEQTNTTLVVVATNAKLSKLELHRVAQRLHDGMARAIVPIHTSYDGDVSFALACGDVKADLDLVSEIAAQLGAEAIRRAVKAAKTSAGIPGLRG
jgi:L-aminopeptidase/D-esterase-like protein